MKKPRGKLLIAIVVPVVLLVVGGAFFLGSRLMAPPQSAQAATPEPTVPGPMYVLKDRVINLADPAGRRYLKVSMSIEFEAKSDFKKASPEERKAKQAEFEKSMAPWSAQIDDAILTLISGRSPSDLATTDGKSKLKSDIKDSVNAILKDQESVNDVYFTQFVMQ